MLSVLSKLGSEYSYFVSTFHSGRAFIHNSSIPSLNAFFESLIQEQDKLVQMRVIHTSKNQELCVVDSNNAQEIGKNRGKETPNNDSKPKENYKSFDGVKFQEKEEIQED